MQSIERSAAKFAARLAVYKPIFALLVKRTHVGVAISNDYLTLAEPVTGAVFESFFFFGNFNQKSLCTFTREVKLRFCAHLRFEACLSKVNRPPKVTSSCIR